MNPFYDLNKRLAGIGQEEKQITESKSAPKTEVVKTLEQALRSDLKSLMEDSTGGMSQSNTLESNASFEGTFDLMDAAKDFAKKWVKRYPGNPNETEAKHYDEYEKFANAWVTNVLNKNGIEVTPVKLEKSRSDFDYYLKQEYDMLSETKTKSYSAKNATAGKDIGKPGKNFAKIAKSSGGGEKGNRIAGAVLAKLRAAHESVKEASAEMECGDAPMPSKGIPGNIPVPGKMDRLRGKRDYYETEEESNDEDIMDYLNRKLAPHDKEQQAKEDAVATPYNKGTGRPDAHNGMEFEGNAFTGKLKSTPKGGTFDLDGEEYTDTSELDEAVSRKHFQQMADLLKNIEDPAKRKELAQHHASLFKLANPRFDHNKFMTAAGCMDEGVVGATLGGIAGAAVGGPVGAVRGAMAGNTIGNAISPDAEVDEGYAEMNAWLKQREAEKGTGRFDKKKISTGTVYTRKPETFAGDDEETSDEPRGRGRPKGPAKGPERVTKGAWKHKDGRVAEEGEEMVDEKAEQGKRKFFDKLAPAAKQVAKVVGKITKSDDKAEKAGKKVTKDIEHDEGDKAKDDNKAERAGKKVTKDIEYDDKKDRKEKKSEGAKPDFLDVDKDGDKKEPFKKAEKDKEEKVDETTTSGSVAPASAPKAAKGGMSFGGGIYDSWDRAYQTLLAESVNVAQESAKMEDGNEEESITVTVTGDDVHRFKELLQAMGVEQSAGGDMPHDDACGTCGGVPCQCDELGHGNVELAIDEADAPVSQNSPDYPTNQEESDDALQYSGGLNKPKRDIAGNGQTTIPVTAVRNQVAESERKSFLDLYKAFAKIK
jgi:hypothetical protein